jgi:hypothetical protein
MESEIWLSFTFGDVHGVKVWASRNKHEAGIRDGEIVRHGGWEDKKDRREEERGEKSEKVWGEVAYARDLVLMTPRLPRLSQRSPPTPPQQPQLLRRWPAQGQDLKHGRRAIW